MTFDYVLRVELFSATCKIAQCIPKAPQQRHILHRPKPNFKPGCYPFGGSWD